jgi:hypothetical protein
MLGSLLIEAKHFSFILIELVPRITPWTKIKPGVR